ncbi:hypothetical protein [Frigoriflavimonas asaccharolytica]|uniref:ABC-type multidrug transport system permease subunit n=1 Tax=Frigoriflavimonas asaccharolytica TaxID=2735899 RepID=A0A8J8GC75_9FLAO|nr:hypothetical protein [Frigoriflavimonas asaccharolytica]NRS93265.1 ABC-type multidrug transport system permease subunit [Frigoriflavimonas asaccharolytica]
MYEFLKTIDSNPEYLVMFAGFQGFGWLILLLISSLFFKIFGVVATKISPFSFVNTVIIMIGWLLGFVTQILLFFMEVPGLKMLIIFVVMYFVIAAFTISNRKALRKQFDKIQDKAKI